MGEPERDDQEPKPNPSSDRGDLIAAGIGCLVVVIMIVAVLMVGAARGDCGSPAACRVAAAR